MKIKNIKEVKPRKVYAIQTSTSTFIADGLAHHNCQRCNNYEGGNHGVYSVWFIKKYGVDRWEEKVRLSKQLAVDIDWDEKTLEYRQKYQELLDSLDN